MAELNASEGGGDFVQIPFYKANLSGDFEVLTDSSSLTPGKITADKQVGVVLHRGDAWEARDLASLASGSDPMAAIGQKVADYVANQRQKDLLSCLAGVFGAVGDTSSAAFAGLAVDGASGDTPTQLTARQIVEGQSLLGDQGDKLAAIVVHPKVYYDLKERRALDMIYDDAGQPDTAAAQGSLANAFGSVAIPTFMGMRVIVCLLMCRLLVQVLPPNTPATCSPKVPLALVSNSDSKRRLTVTSSLRAMPCQSICTTFITRSVLRSPLPFPTPRGHNWKLWVTGPRCTRPTTLASCGLPPPAHWIEEVTNHGIHF